MTDSSALYNHTDDRDPLSPPPLPQDSVYTSCYCEENIYLLAESFCDGARCVVPDWDVYAVFVSNDQKTVRVSSVMLYAGPCWDCYRPLPS